MKKINFCDIILFFTLYTFVILFILTAAMNELMDIDGPEFLSSVNEEIATIRATSETRTSTLASSIVEGTGPAGKK